MSNSKINIPPTNHFGAFGAWFKTFMIPHVRRLSGGVQAQAKELAILKEENKKLRSELTSLRSVMDSKK